MALKYIYRQTSSISHILVGNKLLIAQTNDVVGPTPVGAAYIRGLTVGQKHVWWWVVVVVYYVL